MRSRALSLVESALQAGVAECFENPDTTELPIVTALDRAAGMRVVPGPIHGWALRSQALVLNLGNGDLAVTVLRGYRGISAAMAFREGPRRL